MAIDYDLIMTLRSKGREYSYSDRETMLYALGVGFGRNFCDPNELRFTYEKDLQAVPTMATVIAHGAEMHLSKAGLNFVKIVHGEQYVTLHRPLPIAATVVSEGRVIGAFDKGEGKGALVITETGIRIKETNELLCTNLSTIFARGDGGFLKPGQVCVGSPPVPHALPERAPDASCSLEVREDQALLYRLNGDRNPLHADPEFAKKAGFDKPILHGLCTYGMCCRAIIVTLCDYDSSRIREFNARFSAPVFPGEVITVEMWQDGPIVSFRAWVKARDALVINNGKCVLSG